MAAVGGADRLRGLRGRSTRALLLALCALLLVGSTANAAGWSTQATTPPEGAEQALLSEVACEPSGTASCTAVGKQTRSGTSSVLAEHWNGSRWTVSTAPSPREATESELKGNWCASATSCLAVGFYRTATAELTLAEVWNGREWSIQSTPTPAGATEVRLNGVGCSATNACTAVGYSVVSSVRSATVMRWNGTSWTLQTFPSPAGATSAELDGVACRSTTFCIAAGRYTERSGRIWSLSGTWNGTTWTLATVANPAGATRSVLLDVSCTETTACTAVGGYVGESGRQTTLVERWNGTAWAVQTSANPAGSENSVLQNVSCSEGSRCVAVGDWLNRGSWRTLAESWNGTTWSIETATSLAGASFDILEGVSCREVCLVAGWATEGGGGNVARAQVRADWVAESLSSTAELPALDGVACASESACVGVGSSIEGPLAYLWNGSAWSALSPNAAEGGDFDGVSCPTSSFCAAVGWRGETLRTLAEQWDGSAWTTKTTPNPGSTLRALDGVSCTSMTACTAVGSYFEGGVARTLAIRWNGTTWSTQTTPSPNASANRLSSVSCVSSTSCIAVGDVELEITPLALRWDGTTWSTMTTPTPAGALYTMPTSVSCTSSSACTAVGRYETGSGGPQPFAMRWNGTSWSVQTTTLPAGAAFGLLEGVACATSSACVAVGAYTFDDFTLDEYALALHWDGTRWTAQKPPSPGVVRTELGGVACPAATRCKAVGTFLEAAGELQPFAEQFSG